MQLAAHTSANLDCICHPAGIESRVLLNTREFQEYGGVFVVWGRIKDLGVRSWGLGVGEKNISPVNRDAQRSAELAEHFTATRHTSLHL
jgi:hypothetical protein